MSSSHHSNAIQQIPGELQVIYGPMFSGKTSELLRRIRRYLVRNDSCLLLKTPDSRYENDYGKVVTHDKCNFLEAFSCTQLYDMHDFANSYDIIGIDEGQFFPDIVEFSEDMANRGKVVIVACLDSDYRREPFGHICSLVAKAESVTKLTSICAQCKGQASFTARVSEERDIKVIGGHDKYKPLCRACYNSIRRKISEKKGQRRKFGIQNYEDRQSSNLGKPRNGANKKEDNILAVEQTNELSSCACVLM